MVDGNESAGFAGLGPNVRIESIRLKNFKAFRNVNLTSIPPFMVVVGANGTGEEHPI